MIDGSLSLASLRADSRLPQTMTVLFSCTKRCANPNPIPVAPPVIKILLFDSFMILAEFILTNQRLFEDPMSDNCFKISVNERERREVETSVSDHDHPNTFCSSED